MAFMAIHPGEHRPGLHRATRCGRAALRSPVGPPHRLRIFDGILHYARNGTGDVEPLHGEMAGSFRLRIGDYRVLFTLAQDSLRIFGVRHRSEAYR